MAVAPAGGLLLAAPSHRPAAATAALGMQSVPAADM